MGEQNRGESFRLPMLLSQIMTLRFQYALYIYSPLGPLLGTFNAGSSSFTGPDPGLGIRNISWGPGGNWIAVGGWDQKVLVQCVTSTVTFQLKLLFSS